ncbi:MAG: hypothetical protein R6V01_07525 [Thermoplasmatota archaeon]
MDMKKVLAIASIMTVLVLSVPSVCAAEMIERNNVSVSSDSTETHLFGLFIEQGDDIDIEVESDLPVDVYMISMSSYTSFSNDFSGAVYSKEGVTSTSFTFTVPDSQSYYLVIYNPNNSTATVNYKYTDVSADEAEEAAKICGGLGIMCLVGIVVAILVVVGIIILIIVIVKKKKKK